MWMPGVWNDKFGLIESMSAAALVDAFQQAEIQGLQPSAVLLVSPSYFGTCSNVQGSTAPLSASVRCRHEMCFVYPLQMPTPTASFLMEPSWQACQQRLIQRRNQQAHEGARADHCMLLPPMLFVAAGLPISSS